MTIDFILRNFCYIYSLNDKKKIIYIDILNDVKSKILTYLFPEHNYFLLETKIKKTLRYLSIKNKIINESFISFKILELQ